MHESSARFTGPVRTVFGRAEAEARRRRHGYAGTEHLLLALVAEPSGVAAAALGRLGVTVAAVLRAADRRVEHGSADAAGSVPVEYTPRANRAIEAAAARPPPDAPPADTGDLLVTLAEQEDGVAALVLRDPGLTPDRVREEVRAVRQSKAEAGR